jgi:hypothetical protein
VNLFPSSTAKSARRTAVLALLAVLALSSTTALVLAASGDKDFSVSASPTSQSIVAGSSATYTISIARGKNFTSAVSLSVSGLPAGKATGTFTPNRIPSTTTSASNTTSRLTVTTSSSIPVGQYPLTISASDGKVARTASVTLAVAPAAEPDFTIRVSPSTQTALQSEDVTYDVDVVSKNGFSGSVALEASGYPSDATASLAPSQVSVPADGTGSAKLTVTTGPKTKIGTHTLTVTGVRNGITRSASMVLAVVETKLFEISGNLSGSLTPGTSLPLDLTVRNPHNFAIRITDLRVGVEEGTSNPGCSGTQNFSATELTKVPLTLAGDATSPLSDLGVLSHQLPRVAMLNRPGSQDACKDAKIQLTYSGVATK